MVRLVQCFKTSYLLHPHILSLHLTPVIIAHFLVQYAYALPHRQAHPSSISASTPSIFSNNQRKQSPDKQNSAILVETYPSQPILADFDNFTITTAITNTGSDNLYLVDDPRGATNSWATQTFKIHRVEEPQAGDTSSSPRPRELREQALKRTPRFTGVVVHSLPHHTLLKHSSKDTKADPIIPISPGQTVYVVHEVGRYYDFTLSGPGKYEFVPVERFWATPPSNSNVKEVREIRADVVGCTVAIPPTLAFMRSSLPLSAWSLGSPWTDSPSRIFSDSHQKRNATEPSRLLIRQTPRQNLYPRTSSSSASALSPNFQSPTCTTTQAGSITQALRNANTLAQSAHTHLLSHDTGSELQTRWFGAWDSSRWQGLLNGYEKLSGMLDASGKGKADDGLLFDCTTCTSPHTYAYVYPNSSPSQSKSSPYHTVYLCPMFFQVPATGSGSQADTLVHEGTHFTDVVVPGGTDDVVYGESSCLDLAKRDAKGAFGNADNWAFFADYV